MTEIVSDMFSEKYSDDYTWFQWATQNVLFPFSARLTTERVRATIIRESKTKDSIEPPSNYLKQYNVSLMENAKCRTHVFDPKNGIESQIVIFNCHGGAYITNPFFLHFNFDFSNSVLREIGRPSSLVLVEYPLVPNVAHDTLFEIVESVYRQTVLLYPNRKIVIIGDSAGGGMALVLAQRLAAAKMNGDNVKQPDSVLLLSPWLDVSMSDPESVELEGKDPFLAVSGLRTAGELLAGGSNPIPTTDPAVSPLFGSLDGLPPISVWTSTHDILWPDAKRLRDRVKKEKMTTRFRYYEKNGLLHCFFMLPGSNAGSTLSEIANAILYDCGFFAPSNTSPSSEIELNKASTVIEENQK